MTDQAIAESLPVTSAYQYLPETIPGSLHTNAQRLEVIGLYITVGNVLKVSEMTGVHYNTIYDWRKKEWWQACIEAVREEKADEMDVMLSNIVQTGFQEAHDRLSKGNHAYTKDGEYIGRQEMSGRDRGTLTGIMYDKLRIHRNMPTSLSSNGGTDAKLEILASKMMELSARQDAKVVSEQGKEPEKQGNSQD